MLGIIIQLIISWILLHFIEKKDLSALGLIPTKERIDHFATGLLLPVFYYSILFFALAYLGKNPYKINPDFRLNNLGASVIYLTKSVLFENLIFTGALLYIFIKRLGPTKAILISAISFGIYHWFSWNLFGDPTAMAITFLTTGVAGYVWALAFYRTGSIYLPLALHFGIIFVNMVVFSNDKSFGKQLLFQTFDKNSATPGIFLSIVGMVLYFVGFPLLTYFYVKRIKPPIPPHLIDQNTPQGALI